RVEAETIASGTGDGMFTPNGSLTREMAMPFLCESWKSRYFYKVYKYCSDLAALHFGKAVNLHF
ncbi:MAG: hypothetical protein SOW78_07850, partial [Clostridia bacterium]|nr:hypothetical protein [Clostridia bacterium]